MSCHCQGSVGCILTVSWLHKLHCHLTSREPTERTSINYGSLTLFKSRENILHSHVITLLFFQESVTAAFGVNVTRPRQRLRSIHNMTATTLSSLSQRGISMLAEVSRCFSVPAGNESKIMSRSEPWMRGVWWPTVSKASADDRWRRLKQPNQNTWRT